MKYDRGIVHITSISSPPRYTFGQPVHGKVQVQVCRGFFSSVACEKDKNEICEQFVAQVQIMIFTPKNKFFLIFNIILSLIPFIKETEHYFHVVDNGGCK